MRGPLRIGLLGLCALCACANHVRTVTEGRERQSQVVVDSQASLEGPRGLLEAPEVRVRLSSRQTLERVREPVVTEVEEYTPYEGARELYEVPGGLLSVPLSLVFNALDALLLGYIPNELVNGYTAWTFAALNPALNTENPRRVVRVAGEARVGDPLREREVQEGPLAGAVVLLSFDGREPIEHRTDAGGWLELSLLEELAGRGWLRAPRRLQLVVRDERGAEQLRESLFVDRALALRLGRALPLASLARSGSASPDRRARALFALDRMGFRHEAARWLDAALVELERSPVARDALRQRIDGLYLSPPPLDGVLESLPANTP